MKLYYSPGACYAQRASAGLIVTEATAIGHQAQGSVDVPDIWSDAQVGAWKPVCTAVPDDSW